MRHHNLQVTGSVVVNGLGLATTADLNTYTASADAKISTLQAFTSSVGTTNTFTASASGRLDSIETITASNADRLTSLEIKTGSLATTGSNTFIGTQTITGSLFISSNLIVQGTSSLQNITASAVSIGTNLINLNTANPAIRFAGLVIGDSGSVGGSGSFLYDSVQDEMLFIHRGTSTVVTSSVTLMGPETYDSVGSETYPTSNRIQKGTGNEHLSDSNISDDGTTVTLISRALNGTSAVFSANSNGVTLNAATGTTNTQYKVANTSGDAYFGIAASDGSSIFTGTTANSGYVGTNNNFPFHLATNGTVRFTLASTGAATFGNTLNVIQSNGSGFVIVGSSSGRGQYQNINFGGSIGGVDYGWQVGRSPQTDGVVNDGFYIYDIRTNNAPFTIALGGAATFSSNVRATNYLTIKNNSSNSSYLGFERFSNTQAFSAIYGNGENTTGFLQFVTSDVVRLTISGNGAATFGSSVTAIGTGTFGGTNYLVNTSTGIDPVYQRILTTGGDVIFGIASSTGQSLLSGVSNYATVLYNNTNTDISFGTNQLERMRIDSGGTIQVRSANELRVYRSDNTRYGTFYTDNNYVNIAASTDPIKISSPERTEFHTAGVERMRITSVGSINILGSYFLANSSGGYRFNNQADTFNNFIISDNGNATLRGTLTQGASDERLKNNIKIIPNAIDKIKQLRGVSFEWNQEIYETSRTTDIGVIAQDIQSIFPDAVSLAPFDINYADYTSKSGENYLTVYYEKLIPLLIEGIKEQQSQIEILKAEIQTLK